MSIKVFEAFSGVGTQRMALNKLNKEFEYVGISEIDKYAIESYQAIHGETKNYGDISKVNVGELPEIDLYTYSFPCQDISLSGHMKGFSQSSGTRSSLLWDSLKVIEAKRPKVLLMENVKNLIGNRFKEDYKEWVEILNQLGYTTYTSVLNAQDFGVAQNRERVFGVSIHGEHEEYTFPEPPNNYKGLMDILEDEPVHEKYYLDEDRTERVFYYMKKEGTYDEYTKRLMTGVSPYDRQGARRIGGVFDTDKKRVQSGRVMDKHFQSHTLCTMQGGWRQPSVIIEDENNQPSRIRKLTPKETWLVMGIEEEHFDKVSDLHSNTQLYKQAGNAIAVPVLEAIFRKLYQP